MEFKSLHNADMDIPPMPIDLTEQKAGRFISLSVMLHAVLVATVALIQVPPIEFPQKEVVEFEVESETVAAKPIANGAQIPESKGDAAPAVRTTLPAAAAISAATKMAPAPIAPKAAAPPPVIATAPATVDDIMAPELETSDSGEVTVATINEKDLEDDFDKVDRDNHKALVSAKKSIEEDADQAAVAGDEALKEVEKENLANAKALAQAEKARRKADLAAIAAAEAREKAEKPPGHGTGYEGEGTGNSGSPAPTKEVAGIPGGVRSLEQLRQQPGNKFPQYSQDERLSRQEGQAMFYAYVNKDGSLSQFKLGQSTGYRNLDGKTLAALKKWKFYPGQEGWVEMPFKWTLNGEAMEAGGQLRK